MAKKRTSRKKGVEAVAGQYQGGGDFLRGSWNVRTIAGESVTPDSAMGLSTYWACLRNISEDIAKLPFIVYRRLARGKERDTMLPAYRLMHDQPNRNMAAFTLRERMTALALGWGYAVAEIERGMDGSPVAVHPIHSSRIRPLYDANGTRFWRVQNNPGVSPSTYDIADTDALVIEGFEGRSILANSKEGVALGLAAQAFGAAYYGNGMGLSVAIMHPGKLSQTAHANMRKSWADMHQGPRKAHTPFIGEEGVKIEKMSVPADEAQFLETREFQVEDVCRWFRMPPNKVGHYKRAQGWSTLESTNTDYVTDTLMPWTEKWELECDRKLFFEAQRSTYFCEHLFTGLLRGDSGARVSFYAGLFNIGVLSQNDIRELENMNPIEGGDTYYVPLNMRASDEVVTTEMGGAATGESDDGMDAKLARTHTEIIASSLNPCVSKEAKAVERAAEKFATDPSAFNSWCDKFYVEHVAYIEQQILPGVRSLVTLAGSGSTSIATTYAIEYADTSRKMLESAYATGAVVNLCESWSASRAAEGALKIVDTIMGKDR